MLNFEQTDSAEMQAQDAQGSWWFWNPQTGLLRKHGQPLSSSVHCRTKREAVVHVMAAAPKLKTTKSVVPHWAR